MIQIPKVTYDKIEVLRNEGYKYREIAEKLGTTENVIKKMVYEHNHPEWTAEQKKKRGGNANESLALWVAEYLSHMHYQQHFI